MTPMKALTAAYDTSAVQWSEGPDRVFGVLADALLGTGPSWAGCEVVDVGAGTGTATRRLQIGGARVVSVDLSLGMLTAARQRCECSPVVGDALALPLRTESVDGAVLCFVLNHLSQPTEALREAARVVRPGGRVMASTWLRDNQQPVREVVHEALRRRGWTVPDWYSVLKDGTTPLSDTAEALAKVAHAAGLVDIASEHVEIAVPVSAHDQLEWRLGMPHTAPFVRRLTVAQRAGLWAELATAELPPLSCQVIHLVGRVA